MPGCCAGASRAPRTPTPTPRVPSWLPTCPYLDGRSQARQPFVERRRRLSAVFSQTEHCVVGPGLVGEGLTLGRAVASMGLRALSARRLDGRWRVGEASDAWLRLRLTEAPATPTRPFLVLLEKLPLGE